MKARERERQKDGTGQMGKRRRLVRITKLPHKTPPHCVQLS